MQVLQQEKYGTKDRDFLIHTYRDNNTRTITIEPTEITNGKNERLTNLQSVFRIQDDESLNFDVEKYQGYSEQLAAVKQAIIIYTNQSMP